MAKTKITMFLDSDLIKWLDMNRDEETSRSALVRILIRKAMKTKSRKKPNTSTEVKVDPFIEFYIEQCRESDRGYFFNEDKYLIDLWWDHNKYLYETKTPYVN